MGLRNNFLFETTSLIEKVEGWLVTIISAATVLFTVLASFTMWRYDRGQLKMNTKDITDIKKEMKNKEEEDRRVIAETKEEANRNIAEVRAMHEASTKQISDKLDKLMFYLLHSKITLKGVEETDELTKD
jgi:Fe2+ transport system protein B